jgi:hypothetical protein
MDTSNFLRRKQKPNIWKDFAELLFVMNLISKLFGLLRINSLGQQTPFSNITKLISKLNSFSKTLNNSWKSNCSSKLWPMLFFNTDLDSNDYHTRFKIPDSICKIWMVLVLHGGIYENKFIGKIWLATSIWQSIWTVARTYCIALYIREIVQMGGLNLKNRVKPSQYLSVKYWKIKPKNVSNSSGFK